MKLLSTLALASAFLIGAPVLAQNATFVADNGAAGSGASTSLRAERKARFNFTEEQKKKIGELKDRFALDTASKKAELSVAQRQLRESLKASSVDKGAALGLQNKINGLRADLSTARLNMMLAMSDVFTPEQKEQMKAMRNHRRGGCGGGFGGKHHRGGGFHGGPRVGNEPSQASPNASS